MDGRTQSSNPWFLPVLPENGESFPELMKVSTLLS